MKLNELIQNVIKSEANEAYFDFYDVAEQLGIYDLSCLDYSDEQLQRLKAYWAGSHVCYDTEVGIRIYFFDDQPIAISKQKFRKSDEKFQWISKESAQKLADWFREITADNNPWDIMDLNEDMGTCYLEDDGKAHPWKVVS